MRRELIRSLHCPYTGSPFEISFSLEEQGDRIEYGVATSEAGDFPIVAGVLRLLVDECREPIVSFLRAGQTERATLAALELPFDNRRDTMVNLLLGAAFRMRSDAAASAIMRLKRRLHRALRQHQTSFTDMAHAARSGGWASWNTYRFSMPTFLPVYPLINVMRGPGPVLDFGCGVGHGSFLISRQRGLNPIVCADYSFAALYMARHYFVPDADFVCMDGDFPLPFESNYFSHVYCSDALHCIDGRLGLSQEFARILKEEGAIVLPHLHNKRSPVKFGKSLTPDGYARLFHRFERRMVSERSVVCDYLVDERLNLETDRSAEIDRQEGVSMVASRNPSVFMTYTGLWNQRLARMENPVLNPVYQANGAGIASKQALSPLFVPSILCNGGAEPLLPDHIPLKEIDASGGLNALKRDDPARFRQLAKQFVVIDVPPRFTAARQAGA